MSSTSYILRLLLSCAALVGGLSAYSQEEDYTLIPMPQHVESLSEGYYEWSDGVRLSLPETLSDLLPIARELVGEIEEVGAVSGLSVSCEESTDRSMIHFEYDPRMTPDGYTLRITPDSGVLLRYKEAEGVRYALQTLRQLITPRGLPSLEIEDRPRLPYRGLMLDVSRHYMPLPFILRLLDEMARYKLNKLHWHLTDGGGWRLEIKSIPELVGKTAYRSEPHFMTWWDSGDRRHIPSDSIGGYGGYYTQEEVREVVRFAQERGIEVIPEIEMPSHSSEVLYALPQLSCSGSPARYERDLCLGNPETYTFIHRVLDEVMDLFPSQYIHIGGDEADKRGWETCSRCKALCDREGLESTDALQGYFMTSISEYVTSRGRTAIGWDDVLGGGAPHEMTIMSWRGEEGGITAAKSGHDAIMCPVGILYLDYYQSDRRYEPEANGWTTTFMRTYGYDPVPPSLTSDEKRHIVGVQGNLWTEYVPTPEHAEYMIFPRLLSLAEIGWTEVSRKDPECFKWRLNREVERLRGRGVNSYSPSSILDESMTVDNAHRRILVTLESERRPLEVHYTLDGTIPTLSSPRYSLGDTIVVSDSARIMAAHFVAGRIDGRVTEVDADYHLGVGKRLTWLTPTSREYASVGLETALLDGVRGTANFSDGKWLGTRASRDNVALIDLGVVQPIHKVSTRCMQQAGPGLYMPRWVEVSLSEDGQTFTPCGRILSATSPDDRRQRIETFTTRTDRKARYIKVHYHMPTDDKYLMTDEIVIW